MFNEEEIKDLDWMSIVDSKQEKCREQTERVVNYLKSKGIYLLFFASLIWIKELNYLFYDINQSPDFDKYFVYLEHFFNNASTNREHGLLYYYLQSLHLNFFFSNHNDYALAIHKSVGDVNFYLFAAYRGSR